jgi:hypothetical protein
MHFLPDQAARLTLARIIAHLALVAALIALLASIAMLEVG